MRTTAGTGSPMRFVCSVCRRGRDRRPDFGYTYKRGLLHRVRLTGKVKKHDPSSARGTRNGQFKYEYQCLDCNHVGWSSHNDLMRAAEAAAEGASP